MPKISCCMNGSKACRKDWGITCRNCCAMWHLERHLRLQVNTWPSQWRSELLCSNKPSRSVRVGSISSLNNSKAKSSSSEFGTCHESYTGTVKQCIKSGMPNTPWLLLAYTISPNSGDDSSKNLINSVIESAQISWMALLTSAGPFFRIHKLGLERVSVSKAQEQAGQQFATPREPTLWKGLLV